ASTSPSLAEVVNPTGVQVTVTSSANPSVFGTSVTFTAAIAGTGGVSPTGPVTFKEGQTVLGTGDLVSGSATFTPALLRVGIHTITAVYAGDINHLNGSSGGLVQVVRVATTTTTLASSVNPSVFGQATTLVVTVSSLTPGALAGTVT